MSSALRPSVRRGLRPEVHATLGLPADAAVTAGHYRRVMGITAAMSRALRQEEPVSPWVIDAVLGTMFVIIGVLSVAAAHTSEAAATYREPDAIALLLVLAATVPYFVRRRAPV